MSAFYFYVVAAVLLLLVAVVAVSAVRERALESEDEEEAGPAARRDAALAALRGVEFDYRTGKLPEEEYRRLRREYGREAVRARDEAAALETAPELPAGEDGPRDGPGGTDAGDREGAAPAPPDEEGRGEACAACGAPWRRGARFCARCGARRRLGGHGAA